MIFEEHQTAQSRHTDVRNTTDNRIIKNKTQSRPVYPATDIPHIAQRAVIQREVIVYKPKITNNMTDAERMFNCQARQIDQEVNTAYYELLHNNFSDASKRHCSIYIERLSHYQQTGDLTLLAAAAGYVIESKVNKRIRNWYGVSLQVHDILKNTIPDIQLSNSTGLHALLDITAERRQGHIQEKPGHWTGQQNIIYVAELTYPSINFNNMSRIELTPEEREFLNDRAVRREAEEQAARALCIQDFIRHHNAIKDVIGSEYILAGWPTERQQFIIQYNFQLFGFNASIEGLKLKISDLNIDFAKLSFDNYSPFSMMQNKDVLIACIRQGQLNGMCLLPSSGSPFT